jgi:ABC-type transport system substrate-binding protein
MLLQQGDSVGQSIAHLVQAMYQQVGLKFTLQTINQNDYFQNYVEGANSRSACGNGTTRRTRYPAASRSTRNRRART